MADHSDALRLLPGIDALLRTEQGQSLRQRFPEPYLAERARELVARWRGEILADRLDAAAVSALAARAGEELRLAVDRDHEPRLRPVINATGVVIHTNLGRAPWPERALDRAAAVVRGYSNLELDLESGERGLREAHLARAARLFGAEAVLVVNNNAAAVLLVLDTLARGREVVVSRGELVEIGGSFRIPDVLERSGAILREVGTTNRTHLADYERAINERTAMLLKVHPSNYRVSGFTAAVRAGELAELARRHGIPAVEDQGSGNLVDLQSRGLVDEPTVARSIAAGVDLATFSGDKLLGGPQAGIVAGRRELVERLRRNPLYRALRPDKVTLAALEELFAIYESGDPWSELPALAMIALEPGDLEPRVQALGEGLRRLGYRVRTLPGESRVGGGAAPTDGLPTLLLRIRHGALGADALHAALRSGARSVVARVEEQEVVVDLRTVMPGDDKALLEAFAATERRLRASGDGSPAV